MYFNHTYNLILLLSCLFSFPAIGQIERSNLTYDSLMVILQTDNLSPENRFQYLIKSIETAPIQKVDAHFDDALAYARKFDPSRLVQVQIAKSIFHVNHGEAKKSVQLLEQLMPDIQSFKTALQYKIYYQLAKGLKDIGEKERALEMVEKVIEGAGKSENDNLVALSKVMKGAILNSTGNDEALIYYQAAHAVFLEKDLKNELAQVTNNIGKFYKQRSQYEVALKHYQEFLKIAKELNDQKLIAIGYNNIGTVHHSKGELNFALENYVSSLILKEKIGNKRSISLAYHNIGSIKLDLEDYEGAELDFKKSLNFSEAIDFHKLTGYNLMKIGNVLLDKGKPKEAIGYHEQALDLAKTLNEKSLVMDTKVNLGEDLIALGEYKKAINLLIQANEEAKEFGRKVTSGAALNLIAEAFSKSSNQEGVDNRPLLVDFGKIKQIEKLLLESAEIAYEINNATNIDNSLLALQSFYRQQNNYKQEAFMANQLISHRDSLFSQKRAEALSMWETKYETAEKEKEILLLQKENEIQEVESALTRNRIIIGFVSLFLLSGLGFMYFYYQNQIKRAEQMSAVRTKISSDLHDDVGSILTGLAMQTEVLALTAKKEDKDKLQRIGELSRSAMGRMRDTVWAIDSRKDKIENLLDRMREFAEETLESKEIVYDFKIENIDKTKIIAADQRQNIYLIFKEAITNVIKHSNGDKVEIILKNQGADFIMKIKDNGLFKDKSYKTTGLGMSNMQRRAKQLGGHISLKKENGFEVSYKGLVL